MSEIHMMLDALGATLTPVMSTGVETTIGLYSVTLAVYY